MSRKALFFDIDGTLFSESLRQVPQSAVLALKKTREKGNLVFINTGRTWCQTQAIRRETESDGLLCGCGTYVRLGEKVLYDRRIPAERTEILRQNIERFGLDVVLEGVDSCYFREQGPFTETMKRIRSVLEDSNACSPFGWAEADGKVSKFCVAAAENSDREAFFETIRDFDVIDRGGGFYECVPGQHSKASAIRIIMEYFGIGEKDVWVFGDSMNDLSMFRFSRNSVLMGKHDAGLEPYATFTTRTVEEDGIEWALRHLDLI